MPRPAFDRGGFEQVAVIFEQGLQRVAAFLHLQRQIEFGQRVADVETLGTHVAPGWQLVGRGLQHHHGLNQGRAAGLARQFQRLDHFFEGQVLVIDGAQRCCLDLVEQVGNRHGIDEVAAQRERIGKVADHIRQLVAVAIGDHGPRDDRLLTAVAVEQGLPRREQQHEQGQVVALREIAQ